MAIDFTCPACRRSYQVQDAVEGRTLKCRGCGTLQVVPVPVPAPLPFLVQEVVDSLEATSPISAKNIVRVWARKLFWPRGCPCCDKAADAEMPISATRWKGIRVIRDETKSWTAPYCDDWIRHDDRAFEAGDAFQEGKRTAENALSWLIGSFIFLTLAWIVGVVVLVQQGATVGWAVLWSVGYGVLTGLIAWLLWQQRVSALLRKEAAREEWEQVAASRMSFGCSLAKPAVAYDGWQGTVHTFVFQSPDYGDAFIEANRDKVLG